MRSRTERFEVLKSVVAVAAADGVITRSELGLITALAGRIGIGRRSLHVLIERARLHRRMHEELGRYEIVDKEAALELLVGAAAIDGEVDQREHEQLGVIAAKLGLEGERFERVFARGVERAARLRITRSDDRAE